MINKRAVEHIKQYGTCHETGEQKRKILDEIGFPVGRPAENVIIIGCFNAAGMPHVLRDLKNVLDALKVSYTLLEKEYCCGWATIGRPAVMAKDDEDILAFHSISRDFVVENFRQARALGAKTIALFCSACEPTYTNYADLTELEVISCIDLIDRNFKGGKLDAEVDYYAGCYRFRRKVTDKSIDLKSAPRVLSKIEGLKVNNLQNKYCCYIPLHLEELISTIKSNSIVTICAGCYHNIEDKIDRNRHQIKMLPEIVWESMQEKS